jgi:HEPN domain-containing protein
MNAPRDLSVAARPWLVQAAEDLATARRLVDDGESPPRLAAFLAHLAAEKALKGALIARGIATRKIHDLVELQSSLISDDAVTVSSDDIDILVPWNIAGRYPADLGDPGPETAASAVDAAGRIVDALSRRVLPGG